MSSQGDPQVVSLAASGLREEIRLRLEEWVRTAQGMSGALEEQSRRHLQSVREETAKFVAAVERLIGEGRIPELAGVRDAIGTVLYVSATATQWAEIHAAVSVLSQRIRPYLESPAEGASVPHT